MKTCENCGSRVYSLGCTWCDEEAYIAQQEELTAADEARADNLGRVQTTCIEHAYGTAFRLSFQIKVF